MSSILPGAVSEVDFPPGLVWFVGAGPGDPGLLTIQGLIALRRAATVVHDALIDPRVVAMSLPDAERIYAGKRAGKTSCTQDHISRSLV